MWLTFFTQNIFKINVNQKFLDIFIFFTHCPNSGPHFTPYRTFTTVAFSHRKKIYAGVVMLTFYSSPARHPWPCHNFPSIIVLLSIIFFPVEISFTFFLLQDVILCATGTRFTLFSNSMYSESNFLLQFGLFLCCAGFLLPVSTKFMLPRITSALHLHKTSIKS